MAQLTADLIRRLREEDTPELRRETVTLLTKEFSKPDLQPGEQRLAEAIFRIMARDADVGVRRALSEGLKDNPSLPPELAMTLARDVAEVAVPMLHYSLVFTDDELIEIARSQPEEWQMAVARRQTVNAPVSDVLVDVGSENVVVTLVRNRGAELSDDTSNKVIDKFSDSEAVMTGLAQRPSFPPKLAERLIAAVSAAIRAQLATLPDLPSAIADQLVTRGQESLTLSIEVGAEDTEVRQHNLRQLVRQMDIRGRLTATLITRALCTGHPEFFEIAAARRAGIEHEKVRTLLDDGDLAGAEALCKAARLPRAMAEVIVLARKFGRDLALPTTAESREKFQRQLIEACLPRYSDLSLDDPETLIAKLVPSRARSRQ